MPADLVDLKALDRSIDARKHDDGGPAFSRPLSKTDGGDLDRGAIGMSIRDYFAGQAMALVLSQDGSRIAGSLAEKAYEIADAMLAARKR